jgi:hypothetical protein
MNRSGTGEFLAFGMRVTQTAWVLAHLGFQVGATFSYLSPVLGLAVFWLLPLKPAATIYVVITGLAYALLKWIELERLSAHLDEILRRRELGGSKK